MGGLYKIIMYLSHCSVKHRITSTNLPLYFVLNLRLPRRRPKRRLAYHGIIHLVIPLTLNAYIFTYFELILIGDATVLLYFMHTLSQHYQGLESSYPAPNFIKHAFPDPSCESISKYSPLMPHISHSLGPLDMKAYYALMSRATTRIDWRIYVSQAEMLRDKIRQSAQVENVSLQDCLIAYIVTLLNRCSRLSIRTVTNAASVRL